MQSSYDDIVHLIVLVQGQVCRLDLYETLMLCPQLQINRFVHCQSPHGDVQGLFLIDEQRKVFCVRCDCGTTALHLVDDCCGGCKGGMSLGSAQQGSLYPQ